MTLFQVDAEISGMHNVIFMEAESHSDCVRRVQDQYGLSTVITRVVPAVDGGKTLV